MNPEPDALAEPGIWIGTWPLEGDEAGKLASTALQFGYRRIDTAYAYFNQQAIGDALEDAGVARNELILTSKFPEELAGYEERVLARTLSELRTDHLDDWLIHGPREDDVNVCIWRELVRARDVGLARRIGVSNFTAAQIVELSRRSGVRPALNQLHVPVGGVGLALVRRMRDLGVIPVAHSVFSADTHRQEAVRAIARRHGVTEGAARLGWYASHGVSVVVRATQRRHLRANRVTFAGRLSHAALAELNRLA